MSELAKNEFGEVWSAYEIKDEYLRNGTEFNWFVCAYCDVPLTPVATYGDHYVRRPHFKVSDSGADHATACPYGSASLTTYGIERPQPVTGKVDLEVDLPERLVEIRAPRTGGGQELPKPRGLASPDEIRGHVRNGGATLATAHQYTTGLLRILAEARKAALDKLYSAAKAKRMPAAEHAKFVFDELKKYPLNVYGRKLDYDRAFRKTTREPWKGTFIYFGSATVSVIETGFKLASTENVKGKPDEAGTPASVIVVCDRDHPVNRMERQTIRELENAVQTGSSIRWYAYGEFALNSAGTAYELTVQEPAHVYIDPPRHIAAA